jgi:hypothetical protein
VRSNSRDDGHRDLPDGRGAVEALLTGGNPRSLRNADIVIDAASRQPERLEELVQCVFSADEIVRMRASDALERSAGPIRAWFSGSCRGCWAEMSRIEQPSVQWHMAQILAEVPLDEGQQAQAITVLEHNLGTCGDWIVTNCTLEALGVFARVSPAVRARLTERLAHYQHSSYKSVEGRARKLLAEFDSQRHATRGFRPTQSDDRNSPGATFHARDE